MKSTDQLIKDLDALKKSREEILASLAPLEKEANELQATADQANAAWKAKREEIVAIERKTRLREISREIGVLSRALGAKTLQAG